MTLLPQSRSGLHRHIARRTASELALWVLLGARCGLSRCAYVVAGAALALALSCGFPATAAAQAPKLPTLYYRALDLYSKKGAQLGHKYELKESADVPERARDEPKPLWRFVHITDTHYHPGLAGHVRDALRFISNEVEPRFVVFTGDLAPPALGRALKGIIDQGLGVPWHAVRGDNWPQGFSKTFGDANWSFVCGGMGFVGASLDRDIVGVGIGVFEDDTYEWIRSRLDAHKRRPTILFMHQNLMPPTFLDAARLRLDVEARPNVVATVTGHLHYDYATRLGRVLHMVGPGFGPHPEHPFKVFDVHADHITVRTVKWRDGKFQYVRLYQRVDFPPGMKLDPPSSQARRAEWMRADKYSAGPARELVNDPALAERMLELLPHLLAFIPLTGRGPEIWADLGGLMAEINQAMVEAQARPGR